MGGLTAITLTGVALGGGFSRSPIVTVDPKHKTYKWDCHKWIVDRETKGEVWACDDMRQEQTSRSLIFVLWWLPKGEGEGWNTFTEIDQIKLESDNSLSFIFTSGQEKYSNRKLKNPRGFYWMKGSGGTPEKQPALELKKISEKPLKGKCNLQGNKLSCDSYEQFKAEQEKVESSPIFKLIY